MNIDVSSAFRLRMLLERQLVNAQAVWKACSSNQKPPPFQTRLGPTIYHKWPTDPIYFLLQEIFDTECYTGDGFYRPEPSHTVMDCGANIGIFALYISAKAPGIRVDCYEPASDTMKGLLMNVLHNGLQDSVRTYPCALCHNRSTEFLRNYGSSGRRSFFPVPGLRSQDPSELVKCISLSAALEKCSARTVDFLKIDVEGAEVELVEGTAASTWGRISRVSLEYHEELRPGSRSRILRALVSQGFDDIQIKSINSLPDDPIGIIRAKRRSMSENV